MDSKVLENEEYRTLNDELQNEVDYGKQRENKLMFFLFVMKEMGYPVNDVFQERIKAIRTSRFSTNFIDDDYKEMYKTFEAERAEKERREYRVFSPNRDALTFNDHVCVSDRVYWGTRSSCFSN